MYWYDDDKFWEDKKPPKSYDYLHDDIEDPAEYNDWLRYMARGIGIKYPDIDIDMNDDDVYRDHDEYGDIIMPPWNDDDD